jgi:hypothetical protein
VADVIRHGPKNRPPYVGRIPPPFEQSIGGPRDPCYAYQWWSRDPQRAIEFLAPNLLLTVFSVATALPIGEAVTSRPDVYPVPIAVQWDAPFNPVLTTLTQLVTIPSGESSELPPPRQPFTAADISQRNAQLFGQPVTLPVGEASTELPQAQALFRPADQQPNRFPLRAGEVRSAQVTGDARGADPFTPADLQQRAPQFNVTVVALPIGEAVTERPSYVPRPIALDWNTEPFNASLTQAVTLGSMQMSGLQPPIPDWGARFELTQGRNFQLFQQAPVTFPVGEASTDRPALPPAFTPADVQQRAQQLKAGEIKSGQALDVPAAAPQFRAADVYPTQIAAPAQPQVRSGTSTDLPITRPPFFAADLRNALLPPLETFAAFPFRQQDWPLPFQPPPIDRSFQQEPFVITPAPAVSDDFNSGGWPIYRGRMPRKKLLEDIERERQAIQVLEAEESTRERAIARAKSEQTREREQARLRRVEADRREHESMLLALTQALADIMRAERDAADEEEIIELFLRLM